VQIQGEHESLVAPTELLVSSHADDQAITEPLPESA
jgi:hypothetical protein